MRIIICQSAEYIKNNNNNNKDFIILFPETLKFLNFILTNKNS